MCASIEIKQEARTVVLARVTDIQGRIDSTRSSLQRSITARELGFSESEREYEAMNSSLMGRLKELRGRAQTSCDELSDLVYEYHRMSGDFQRKIDAVRTEISENESSTGLMVNSFLERLKLVRESLQDAIAHEQLPVT